MESGFSYTENSRESYHYEWCTSATNFHQEGMAKGGFKGSVIQILQNTSESNGHPLQETSEKLLEFWGIGNHEEFLATPNANGYRSSRAKVSDQVEVKTLAVYPNPTGDHAYINYLLPDGWEKGEVNMYDSMGKLVHKFKLSMFNRIIDVDTKFMTDGIYTIELIVDTILVSNEKLIVIR